MQNSQVQPGDELITLTQFLLEEQLKLPHATGDFTALLSHFVYAAKIVTREVRKAGLLDHVLGSTSNTNVQGETQMKLDAYADRIITDSMKKCGHLCIMASEENDDAIEIPEQYPIGKYTFVFDPLDGSSNIDSNVSIGSIFSIHLRRSPTGRAGKVEDMLQKGALQRCAGYVIYGSSTMLILTTGHGVNGFTLDPSCGEFLLSHPNMKMPESGNIYSINEGNYNFWSDDIKEYIKEIKKIENPGGPRTLRYIGSLVADFHRNLLKGGIFLYPQDAKSTKYPKGKLRLLYEAAPMAYIAEQAGGMAVTVDGQRVLDIQPESLHERTTLITGSKREVEHFLEIVNHKKVY